MEQSLVEHENYIVELQDENAYQNVMYERAFVEVEKDREAWKAQCLARQLYIRYTTKQIYKAVHKVDDMLEKAKALYREVVPTRKNGQRLVNFLEEARNHYEQVKAFYGYNCNMLNNVYPMRSMKWFFYFEQCFWREFQICIHASSIMHPFFMLANEKRDKS